MKRICNWCAKVVEETANRNWTRATLRIDGLHDGSISWLPERTLDFCDSKDCVAQLVQVEGFLLEAPHVGLGQANLRVWLRVEDDGAITRFDEARYWGHEDAAEDARALARFFNCTSHPKLRRLLEAFESDSEPEARSRGPQSPSEESGVVNPKPEAPL